MGSERYNDVNRCGECSAAEAGDAEPNHIGGSRDESESDGFQYQESGYQPSPFVLIPEGHEKQHAEAGADLCEHGDTADPGDGKAELARHVGKQRLHVINVRNNTAGAECEKPDY